MALYVERGKQVCEHLMKFGHITPLYVLLEQLRTLGYSEPEIKLGIGMYMLNM